MKATVPARQIIENTSLSVSALCLGGNRFGSSLDERESFALLDEFVELGGNFIDTAAVYANWIPGIETSCSERTIGRWLSARNNTSKMVIATKGGHPTVGQPSLSRLDFESIRTDALSSLEHLGIESLQLFYLHRDDLHRPIEQIIDSLEVLVNEGLIQNYAASNFSATRLEEAQRYASENGIRGFVANQLEWSLARPRPEMIAADLTWMDSNLAEFHRESPMTVIPYSSQARGYFDQVLGKGVLDSTRRYDTELNANTAQRLSLIARRHGVENTTMALAGMLHTGIKTIPVVGSRTIDQLRSSWASLSIDLNHSEREWFESIAL